MKLTVTPEATQYAQPLLSAILSPLVLVGVMSFTIRSHWNFESRGANSNTVFLSVRVLFKLVLVPKFRDFYRNPGKHSFCQLMTASMPTFIGRNITGIRPTHDCFCANLGHIMTAFMPTLGLTA